MKLILYMCEGDFENYIKNISAKNEVIFCLDFQVNYNLKNDSLFSDTIQIDTVLNRTFDYIIIMSRDSEKTEEVEYLLKHTGVSKDKILRYCNFEKNPIKSPIEYFLTNSLTEKFEVLMFGMSHSYGGFIECLSRKNIYKFSAPSMDLYYHYKVLQEVCKYYDMSHVKRIIFELPYYIFNYDTSMCKRTFLQRMNYYMYLGDYHNYGNNSAEKRNITEFELLNDLCAYPWYLNKYSEKKYIKSKNGIKKLKKIYWKIRYFVVKKEEHTWTFSDIEKLSVKKHVWYQIHDKTIDENCLIWKEIVDLVNQYKGIEIYIVVFPFCPYFISSHKEAIEQMKQLFLKKINIPSNQLIDFFDVFKDKPELFEDECHLNLLGAMKLTDMLNVRLDKGEMF